MDKAEYQVKLDEINRRLESEDYEGAAKIADSIEWKKVKSVRTLNMIGGIYEVNKRYEDASRIFLQAYKRAPLSKSVLCSLVEINLKLGEYDEAISYYNTFAKHSKNDNTKYVLKYKILKARRSPLKEQIAILEEYKEHEYTEKWAYELARLYQQAGMTNECVEQCDDLILWFSDGTYVMKAMELKMRFAPLSPSQRITYENRHQQQVNTNKNPFSEEAPISIDRGVGNTFNGNVNAQAYTSPYSNGFRQPDQVAFSNPVMPMTSTKAYINPSEDENMPENSSYEGMDQPVLEQEQAPIKIGDMEQLQDRFAKGIRSVFSGGASESEQDFDIREDEYQNFIQASPMMENEDESEYLVVKELEPEVMPQSTIHQGGSSSNKNPLQSFVAVPNVAVKQPNVDFDLEALMAETAVGLAQEVATGDYEQTALLEEEKKIAREKAMAKEASLREMEARQAAKETALAKDEAGVDFGLTREFSFDQELKEFKAKMAKSQQDTADIQTEMPNKVEEFVLPADVLAEIEAKKANVVEEVPLMEAPIIENFRIVPQSERGKAFEKAYENPAQDLTDEVQTEAIPKQVESKVFEETQKDAISSGEPEAETIPGGITNDLTAAIMEMESETPVQLESSGEDEVVETIEQEPIEAVSDEGLDEVQESVEAVSDEGSDEVQESVEAVSDEGSDEVQELFEASSDEGSDEIQESFEASSDEVQEALETSESDDLGVTKEINVAEVAEKRHQAQKKVVAEADVEEDEEIQPRRFNPTEKKLFTYFSSIPGMDMQLTTAIEDIKRGACEKTSKKGNVIIMGRKGSGKTRLAGALVGAACKNLEMEAVKVAYIDAKVLNQKDPVKIVAKLAGGFLVIENAGDLSELTLNKLSKSMEFRTESLKVILEDEKAIMNQLLERRPDLAEKFTSKVAVPVFTNDELVTFAKAYASENGYRMDDMGVLALYTLIGNNQNENEPITVAQVRDMMDTAMKKTTKGARRLGRRFSKKNQSEKDKILLYEKDFNY